MTNHSTGSSFTTLLRIPIGLAVVWIIAAAIRPTATYHLAPILIAGIAPFLGSNSARSVAAVLGATIAVAVSLVLAGLDLLKGPGLLPSGGALVESVAFAAAGAGGGWLLSTATAGAAAR